MIDKTETYRRARRGGFSLGGMVSGAVLGLALAAIMPKPYVAEVSLLFPTINNNALKQVLKTLKVDGSNVDWKQTVSTSDPQMVQAATLVFKSRAAITSALKSSNLVLPPGLGLLQGDSLETFRNQNIEIDGTDTSLRLKVTYSRAESARALCQGLLDYYTSFVHEHRLTNTARTRQQLEEKLVRVDRRLSVLEKKLVLSPDSRFQAIMDPNVRGDSKVMRELWKQRILEGGSSSRILDEMRKIRKEADAENSSANVTEEPDQSDWKSRWGSTTIEEPSEREASLSRTTRRESLPSRLELERVYEETLLLYHAGLLQYDFLGMWEGLENFDFEVVDPVTVHQASLVQRMLWAGALGGLVGGLLFSLLSRKD